MLLHMKIEQTYRWRVQWMGRWTTTRHHCTEEQIRREHSEAQRLDDTLIVREVAETPQEQATAHNSMTLSVSRAPHGQPGGWPPKARR